MIISAPTKEARHIFGHRLTVRNEVTDRHIPGCDHQALTEERKEVIEWLMNSLHGHQDGPANGPLSRVCDYTGFATSWTKGPRIMSIEAEYLFVLLDGRIAYHWNPNVHVVDNAVNQAKRGYLLIYLLVLADWINTIAELSFEARKYRLARGFNAVSNIYIPRKVFAGSKNHAHQVKAWNP
ncbi:hypothetical protein ACHAPJ_007438 [Fusarium lateritium]